MIKTSRTEMLPIVADPLPKMLPFKPLTFNDVADVATFPTSYMYFLKPGTLKLKPYAAFWKATEGYRRPPGHP
jgi:hypothetical protein